MGFLDQLTNLSPEQSQGLLAAAAQMLQQSGPSRMPTSFGQILGGGLGAYQSGMDAAQKRKLEDLIGQQTTQMNAYKLKDAEADYKNQELTRARQQQIQAGIAGLYAPTQAAPGGLPAALGAAPPGALPSSQPAASAAPKARVNRTEELASRLLDEAAVYSQYGDSDGAAKRIKQATELLPQVHNIEQARDPATGKLVNVVTLKDGTQKVSEFGVKPDFKVIDQGGKQTVADLNAATNGQSYVKSMTPGESATNSRALERLNFDKSQVGKPTFSAEAGGYVVPPSAENPNGKLLPVAGIPGKAPTEFQGKSAAFGLRATEANKILTGLEKDGVTNTGILKSVAQGAGGMVPFIGDKVGSAVGSGFNTLPGFLGGPNQQQQQVEQARRDFVNAVLRQESGAAIGAAEFDNAMKQYFPQPGDGPKLIEQKQRNRELAIQGLQANAGRAALTAPAKGGGWGIQKVGD